SEYVDVLQALLLSLDLGELHLRLVMLFARIFQVDRSRGCVSGKTVNSIKVLTALPQVDSRIWRRPGWPGGVPARPGPRGWQSPPASAPGAPRAACPWNRGAACRRDP